MPAINKTKITPHFRSAVWCLSKMYWPMICSHVQKNSASVDTQWKQPMLMKSCSAEDQDDSLFSAIQWAQSAQTRSANQVLINVTMCLDRESSLWWEQNNDCVHICVFVRPCYDDWKLWNCENLPRQEAGDKIKQQERKTRRLTARIAVEPDLGLNECTFVPNKDAFLDNV